MTSRLMRWSWALLHHHRRRRKLRHKGLWNLLLLSRPFAAPYNIHIPAVELRLTDGSRTIPLSHASILLYACHADRHLMPQVSL